MRTTARRRARGFTLLEMMVAVLIGGISVVMAAKIAETVMRQNAKGRQRTDFSTRSRLLGHQLRSDLRLAGIGSTGAVAVPNVPPWSSMGAATRVGNFFAIPVIHGANAVGATVIGGLTVQAQSDVIQILVPNPGSLQRTVDRSPSGANVVRVPAAAFPVASCPLIYATDHTSPSGAGRSQLAMNQGGGGTTLNVTSPLPFTIAAGSDVMCARLSTYWIDNLGGLHRTDLTSAPAIVQLAPGIWVDANGVANDLVAPGVLDLQIAYRVSKEVYQIPVLGAPLTNDSAAQWVFEGDPNNPSGRMTALLDAWYEVRLVRVNLLGRTLRKINATTSIRNLETREDGPVRQLVRTQDAEWITTTESVVNLRFFDLGAPTNVPPEPY